MRSGRSGKDGHGAATASAAAKPTPKKSVPKVQAAKAKSIGKQRRGSDRASPDQEAEEEEEEEEVGDEEGEEEANEVDEEGSEDEGLGNRSAASGKGHPTQNHKFKPERCAACLVEPKDPSRDAPRCWGRLIISDKPYSVSGVHKVSGVVLAALSWHRVPWSPNFDTNDPLLLSSKIET
jgi:hypothetical protein